MKHFFIVFALIFTLFSYSNEVHKIEIPEGFKVEATFSATLNNSSSFHMVFTKKQGEKSFVVLSTIVSEDGEYKNMKPVQLNNLSSIISHHINGETLSLIGYDEKKKRLTVIDFNTESSEHEITVTDKVKKPYILFRLDHKTVIINKDKFSRNLSIQNIVNGKDSEVSEISIPKDRIPDFKLFVKETPDAVNRNEYVKTGSINKRKAYISDNSLVFSYDDKKHTLTKTMTINLDKDKESPISFKFFRTQDLLKVKNYNSYLFEENLFTISSSKDDLVFKSYGVETEEEKASFTLSENLKDIYSESESYLKSAGRSKMKPTLTINKTKDNNFVVNIDQVDTNTYNYHYDWWFHHWMWQQHIMNHQMMVQQNMMNSMPNHRFGPNADNYNVYAPFIKNIDPIKFVLDKDFNVLKNGSQETKFNDIDKDKALKPFKENKKIKEITACFTKNEMRYIYLDKKTKEVLIKIKPVK